MSVALVRLPPHPQPPMGEGGRSDGGREGRVRVRWNWWRSVYV